MLDIDKENTPSGGALAAPGIVASIDSPELARNSQTVSEEKPTEHAVSASHSRHKPRAEIVFDKAVYGGISYAAQAATGVVLTHWIKHGSGRKYFDKMANWAGEKLISKITSKKGEDAVKEADSWIVVTTMVMVGNAFLLPVKWLENRKPKIVRWINEKQNDRTPPTPEQRAQQEKDLADLDKEPKQNWWSLLGGRAFGLGAVYAVLWGLGEKRNNAAENATVTTLQKGMKKIGLEKYTTPGGKTDQYMRIGFYDVFYSMVSAGGLYLYSHFINPPHRCKNRNDVGCEPDSNIPALPVTENTEETAKRWANPTQERKKIDLPATSFTESVAQKQNETVASIA